ncbi:MAG: M3 family metallopeptidase [Weeksellaceae bacterium]|nr:M3 family metallopeptidase [Weeksellaceae bacterium]
MTQILPDNPLSYPSTLPYQTPDYNKIEDHHFLHAMQTAMDIQNRNVENIVKNSAAPTFENTLIALESSGRDLSRISMIFSSLAGAHTNDKIKETQRKLSPLLSQHRDGIYLNSKLFAKVDAVYENRKNLNLSAEDLKLVEEYHQRFVLSGARLNDAQKKKLSGINAEMAGLETEFNQKLLEATNSVKLPVKKEELKGLTDTQIENLKQDDGSYAITLMNTTQQPLLSSLDNRDLRKRLLNTSIERLESKMLNTSQIVEQLVRLREQKAHLLGFGSFAEWRLQDTMAQDPATVFEFFREMVPGINKKADAEKLAIETLMRKDGITDGVKPWDWAYYAEKVRADQYSLDENELKQYFELYSALENGVFYAANKLYGISFKKRTDIPVYHPDVVVYEIFEHDGTPMALFFGDFFARPSKRGGAWMSNLVQQSHLFNEKPVITNVCNYQKPPAGEPALISFDDVTTLFHEFGHALHGLFADQKYAMLSGTSVARDFVELPSQANEYWATHPEVLQNYAKHHKTGEPIPADLIEKLKNSRTFNQGFSMTEVMGAAFIDLHWHTDEASGLPEGMGQPRNFDENVLRKENLWNDAVPPRYFSSYFAHVFGGGYAAGYYSYLWTEMLAHDTSAWFAEQGGLSRAAGDRYRKMILSQGNTQEYKSMYRNFRGAEPQIKHMLQARGLN